MAASAGQDFNGNKGGEGGTCKFSYTLKRNTEYVFKLGTTIEPTSSLGRGGAGAYFYEKGRLLVACGGGGASGWSSGRGGAGGGPSVAGAPGSGSDGGAGGQNVPDGQLSSEGQLDFRTTGGKIESCTTGNYYAINGFSPCEDVENILLKILSQNGMIIREMRMRKVLKSQEDIKQVTEPHMVTGTMEESSLLMQVAHSLVVAEQEHMGECYIWILWRRRWW